MLGTWAGVFVVTEDRNQSYIMLGRRIMQKIYLWLLLLVLNVVSITCYLSHWPRMLSTQQQLERGHSCNQSTALATKVACFLTLILWFAFRQIPSAQPRPSPALKLSSRQIIPTLGGTKKYRYRKKGVNPGCWLAKLPGSCFSRAHAEIHFLFPSPSASHGKIAD